MTSEPAEVELRVVITSQAARGRGVGSALLDGARAEFRAAGLRRAWLVTTNDNLDVLGFYQRRGGRTAALRPGAVNEARRTLKASNRGGRGQRDPDP
jgi:ribosomal protein S18 acetylase RimI-like enzyme